MKECQVLSTISSIMAGLPGDPLTNRPSFLELFEPVVDVVRMWGGFLLNSFLTLNTNDFVSACHGADI